MTEKKKYEKPSMEVFKLQHRTHLLQASGQKSGQLEDPDDYLDGGDPFNNSNAPKKDLWDEDEFEE